MRRTIAVLLFIGWCNGAVLAESKPPQIRLVVLVVVDQMRGDYLARFSEHFGQGGFDRLMNEGADFRNAYFSYGSTATAPGHATISTGRLPRQHGIVGNGWFLEAGSTKAHQAIDDPDCKVLGPESAKSGGLSCRNLIGPAFGDAIKLADARSRMFSVAMKDRAAILLGGKKPDGVFWWDLSSGRYCSSTYYAAKLPGYVEEFNMQRWSDRFAGKSWEKLLPDEAYAKCHPLEVSELADDYGLGTYFPHALPAVNGSPGKAFYRGIFVTPFGNDIVLEMTKRVLSHEKLGRSPAADLLCVGFSSNDMTGHVFGPESPEMMDMTVRTDRQLAELLNTLDEQVGREHFVIALTADHGVKSASYVAKRAGLGGGLVDLDRIQKNLEDELVKQIGPPQSGGHYVAGLELPWVYLDASFEKMDAGARSRILQAGAAILRKVDGIADVITAPELAGAPPLPQDRHRYYAWRCYHPQRSGQLYLQLAPYWYEVSDKTTGHSTDYDCDRHVPILICGPGVRAGRYFKPADPMDIVATLSVLLGIEPPLNPDGRILDEALGMRSPAGRG